MECVPSGRFRADKSRVVLDQVFCFQILTAAESFRSFPFERPCPRWEAILYQEEESGRRLTCFKELQHPSSNIPMLLLGPNIAPIPRDRVLLLVLGKSDSRRHPNPCPSFFSFLCLTFFFLSSIMPRATNWPPLHHYRHRRHHC